MLRSGARTLPGARMLTLALGQSSYPLPGVPYEIVVWLKINCARVRDLRSHGSSLEAARAPQSYTSEIRHKPTLAGFTLAAKEAPKMTSNASQTSGTSSKLVHATCSVAGREVRGTVGMVGSPKSAATATRGRQDTTLHAVRHGS